MSDTREIRKRIAALEGQVAAIELPADVRADIEKRHKAKTYASANEVPASSRMVAVVERQAYTPRPHKDTSEKNRLLATLAKLQTKVAALKG